VAQRDKRTRNLIYDGCPDSENAKGRVDGNFARANERLGRDQQTPAALAAVDGFEVEKWWPKSESEKRWPLIRAANLKPD